MAGKQGQSVTPIGAVVESLTTNPTVTNRADVPPSMKTGIQRRLTTRCPFRAALTATLSFGFTCLNL